MTTSQEVSLVACWKGAGGDHSCRESNRWNCRFAMARTIELRRCARCLFVTGQVAGEGN